MAYRFSYTADFIKDLKNLSNKNRPIGEFIRNCIKTVIASPEIDKPKQHNLTGVMALHEIYNGTHYRIFYMVHQCCDNTVGCEYLFEEPEINSCNGVILFLYAGTRESTQRWYKTVKRQDIERKRIEGLVLKQFKDI